MFWTENILKIKGTLRKRSDVTMINNNIIEWGWVWCEDWIMQIEENVDKKASEISIILHIIRTLVRQLFHRLFY